MKIPRFLSPSGAFVLLLWSGTALNAQTAGRLYDPEPPVDSAYVRVVLAGDLGKMAVSVDGKVRIPSVAANQASHYMVLKAGKHQLDLNAPAKSPNNFSMSLDVIPGRAMTVVFTPTTPPTVIEDKTGSNKLKAMLSVYQFASKQKPLDMFTSDGKTQVYANLAYGKSAAIAVNPIAVELLIQASGEPVSLGKAVMSMTQGNSYSIILLPEKNGKIKSVVLQNKVERYTGN